MARTFTSQAAAGHFYSPSFLSGSSQSQREWTVCRSCENYVQSPRIDNWVCAAHCRVQTLELVDDRSERLLRLICDEERPVQFVFAGKAHPQDQGAKQILQQLAQWKYEPRVQNGAVFLQDYDQEIARQLVQSVDVWLNVPRRPLEASGTSGEKVAVNGGLNLSILDGWWLEAYDGSNGFAIGDMVEAAEAADVDALDAESLYRVLEEQLVPLFYDQDRHGLPVKWVAMMKRSIQTLVPEYNSDRMVEEYARRIYST